MKFFLSTDEKLKEKSKSLPHMIYKKCWHIHIFLRKKSSAAASLISCIFLPSHTQYRHVYTCTHLVLGTLSCRECIKTVRTALYWELPISQATLSYHLSAPLWGNWGSRNLGKFPEKHEARKQQRRDLNRGRSLTTGPCYLPVRFICLSLSMTLSSSQGAGKGWEK